MSKKSNAVTSARKVVMTLMTSAIETCDEMLDPLNEGEKVLMETMVNTVATKHNLRPEKVYPFVSTYLNSRTDLTVVRGKYGGVFKGPRPVDPKVAERLLKRAQKAEEEAAQAAARAAELRAKASQTLGES